MCEQEDVKARRARDRERWHRRSEARRARNVCQSCGRQEPAPGRTRCEPCLEKRRIAIANGITSGRPPGSPPGCAPGAASVSPPRTARPARPAWRRTIPRAVPGTPGSARKASPGGIRPRKGGTSARDAVACTRNGNPRAPAPSAAVPRRAPAEPRARLAPGSIVIGTGPATRLPGPRDSSTAGATPRPSAGPAGRAAAAGRKPAALPACASVAGTAGPRRQVDVRALPREPSAGQEGAPARTQGDRPLRQVRRALGRQGALQVLRRREEQAAQIRDPARGRPAALQGSENPRRMHYVRQAFGRGGRVPVLPRGREEAIRIASRRRRLCQVPGASFRRRGPVRGLRRRQVPERRDREAEYAARRRRYADRRARGRCVSCEAPSPGAARCEPCARRHAESSGTYRGIPVWDPLYTVVELATGREHGPFDSEADVALCLAFAKLSRNEVEVIADAPVTAQFTAPQW